MEKLNQNYTKVSFKKPDSITTAVICTKCGKLAINGICDKVFKTVIRDNVALAEAPIKGLNIFEYNKNSNGAKDYMELAKEVLKLK